jgi:hypothetical protein
MTNKEFEKECDRVIQEMRYARQMQKKRLYEQAKRQRKAERLAKNGSNN